MELTPIHFFMAADHPTVMIRIIGTGIIGITCASGTQSDLKWKQESRCLQKDVEILVLPIFGLSLFSWLALPPLVKPFVSACAYVCVFGGGCR